MREEVVLGIAQRPGVGSPAQRHNGATRAPAAHVHLRLVAVAECHPAPRLVAFERERRERVQEAEDGVDVEKVRPIPDADGVARSFFSPRETAELESVPEAARHRAFFDGWTRKEAFLKALGDGLARPLDSFDVTLKPGDTPRLLRTLGDPEEANQYSLYSLEPEEGYVAAIALRGHGWQVRHARWRWIEERRAEGGEAT